MSIIFPNVTYNVALFNFIEFKCKIFLILCQIFNQFSAAHFIFIPKTLYYCSTSLQSFFTVTFQFWYSAIINLKTLHSQKWICTPRHCHNFKIIFHYNVIIIVEQIWCSSVFYWLLFFPALYWKISQRARENQAESGGLIMLKSISIWDSLGKNTHFLYFLHNEIQVTF